jgi:hypothetical protein
MALHGDAKLHGEPVNFGPATLQSHSVGALVTTMAKHWESVRREDRSSGAGEPYESGLFEAELR